MDISASMIKDILSCSMKGYYRMFKPEVTEQTVPLQIGSIVHSIIETKWMNYNQAILEAGNKCIGLDDEIYQKVCGYLTVFFENFTYLLSYDDIVEKNFSIDIGSGINLVGKIDRLNPDTGILLDWKTTNRVPSHIDNDIQFIIYNYAYRKIYKKQPALVALAALKSGKLIKFNHNEFYEDTLFNDIIPYVIDIMKNKKFAREGMFHHELARMSSESNLCKYCQYKSNCWGWSGE